MGFFKMSEVEEVKGFEIIKVGEYEVTVINAEGAKTQAGKDKLVVDFEIRSDVNQEFQGLKVQYNTFTFEHPTARGIAKSLFKAVGFDDSYDPDSVEQMAKDLYGKNLKIWVKHEKNDNGKTFPKSSSYKPSEVDAPIPQGAPINVGDEDLPF